MKRFVNLRQLLLLLIDGSTLALGCLFSFFFLSFVSDIEISVAEFRSYVFVFTITNMIVMGICQIYKQVWRYATNINFISLMGSIVLGSLGAGLLAYFLPFGASPTFQILSSVIAVVAVSFGRLVYIYSTAITTKHVQSSTITRTMVIGGGSAGTMLLREFALDNEYVPVCVVDDDESKIGRKVCGCKVCGPTDKIPMLCQRLNIGQIVFAIPTASETDRKRILEHCAQTECKLKMLPTHRELMDSDLTSQIHDIQIEDLLGRGAVTLDLGEVKDLLKGATCMVTGGGGSIGSELCRQIAQANPKELIIVDCYENNAYSIQQELIRNYGDSIVLSVMIASVRDYGKMHQLFERFHPDFVFHAAAHKHVPLMENSPEEAVKNNVFGTWNVARLADKFKVKKFVLISSDKAVNPTNVMGATKRCCEKVIQYMAQTTQHTEYVAVRFGNVLGSNGSVIPLFQKQIDHGGPITVTDPNIIRYFMTIPEAVSLILKATSMAKGGEIFVLDMGDPVKIVTLAEKLIRLNRKEPYKEIDIVFTGLRPGEKLYEELLMSEEGLCSTSCQKVHIGQQIDVQTDIFVSQLEALELAAHVADYELLLRQIKIIVPTFVHEQATEKAPKMDYSETMLVNENCKEPQFVSSAVLQGSL